jgi:hypothetical protein
LREILSNAYDADARTVHIRTIDDGRSLVITDDGVGMDKDEFRSRYARIATPKGIGPETRTKKFKRKPIGKFGIGHLAIAPTCTQARIVTTRGRGHPVFEAVLDYEEYLSPENLDRPLSDVYKYFAKDLSDTVRIFEGGRARAGRSFTSIELEGLKEEIADDLSRPGLSLVNEFDSISELAGSERLAWELGVIAPVPYVGGGPVSGYSNSILSGIVRELKTAHFEVRLGDKPVRRPVRLPAFGRKFKESPRRGLNYEVFPFREDIKEHGLKFRGYIFNQSSQIVPRELRGVLVRVRGVAIGLYRSDFLGAHVTSSVFRDSTTGEIYVDEGLDNAITLDRSNFKDSDPAFRALRAWLERFLEPVRTGYWARGKRRQTARKEKKGQHFSDLLTRGVSDYFAGPAAPPRFAFAVGRAPDGRPCFINTVTGEIRMDPRHRIFRGLPVAGKEREILQICLYAIEIAKERAGGDVDRYRREALEIMEELISKAYRK